MTGLPSFSLSKKSGWSWAFSDRYGRMDKGDEKMLERGKMEKTEKHHKKERLEL